MNLNDSRPTNSITTEEAPQKQNCCPELPKQNCCPGGSPEVQGLQGLREERRGAQRRQRVVANLGCCLLMEAGVISEHPWTHS